MISCLIQRVFTYDDDGKHELAEYVNDGNREYTEVLMELNINGIMDTFENIIDREMINDNGMGC